MISLKKIDLVFDNMEKYQYSLVVGEKNGSSLIVRFYGEFNVEHISVRVERKEKKRKFRKDIAPKNPIYLLSLNPKEKSFIEDSDWKEQGCWIKDFEDYINREYDSILNTKKEELQNYDENYRG